MKGELKIFLAVFPAAILFLLLFIFLRRCCCYKRRTINLAETPTRTETIQSGIAKLHRSYSTYSSNQHESKGLSVFHHQHPQNPPFDKRRQQQQKPNYYVIRRGVLTEPRFNWADHPRLISEAVENGWPRFAFAALSPSLPRSKSVWEFCAVCDYGGEGEAEISWEISSGSSDCLQKIKLGHRLKKNGRTNGMDFSYVRMELPLPGPPLGNSSFPQEAYFEISFLSGEEEVEEISGVKRSSAAEDDQVKLISEIGMKTQSDSLVDEDNKKKIEEKKDEKGSSLISLGLDGGGFPHFKLPGTYSGSIGFNSNGSVYLDGIKLVFEAEEADWKGTDKVIGCGFDPGRKRVFFTVDSKLVHAIHCKPEEFGSPLYPILASNADITVVVNMGQTTFKYAPANLHRTPNPCFFRPVPDTASPALRIGYEEDSRELFSMGRIDSKWLGSRNKNGYGSDENTVVDVDAESEIDELFEIVLDDRSENW
ncbi:hypothetical protein AAC387_Pa03g3686 [Persea americana]